MRTIDFLAAVHDKKGQFIHLNWKRDVKLAAAFKNLNVEKETFVVARTGIEYDNLNVVKEGRQDGSLPSENAGLQTNMKWLVYPWVIRHEVTNKEYARLYAAPNQKPQVRWFLNGVVVPKDTVLPFMTPSDKKRETERTSSFDCFIVKMEDLYITSE